LDVTRQVIQPEITSLSLLVHAQAVEVQFCVTMSFEKRERDSSNRKDPQDRLTALSLALGWDNRGIYSSCVLVDLVV
jgi:hypothetical protein